MTYRGRMKNGVIVLESPAPIAEGEEVSIRPLKGRPVRTKKLDKQKRIPSLYDRLKPVIGIATGPPDLAKNLDHYLHGLPKK